MSEESGCADQFTEIRISLMLLEDMQLTTRYPITKLFAHCIGRSGVGMRSSGPKFLHFDVVFGKNWPNNRLAAPLGVGTPSLGNPGSTTALLFLCKNCQISKQPISRVL